GHSFYVASNGCAGLEQAIYFARTETRFFQDRARMRTIVGRRAWLLFFAVGNEDRTVNGFEHAMAWVFEICDRAAIAHLRIAHRFVERWQRRPLDIVSAELLAPMTQRLRFELR